MPNFDPALLERIKSLVPISRLVGEYLEADARKSTPDDLWGLCPFHSEATPSFHADDSVGVYKCFGCDAKGDHFRFLEEHQGMTFPQAVQRVADLAGVTLPGARNDPSAPAPRAKYDAPAKADPYKGYTFLPVPNDAPAIKAGKKSPRIRKPREAGTDKEWTHYTPEDVYPYHDQDGQLLGYVIRQATSDGKKLTPGIWWMRAEDGWEGWSHGSLPSPRPMDGLLGLLANPDKQVLVVEGEKCRKAAAEALAGRVVVVSWLGGTSAVKQTDWSPLEGRSVIYWPDNDDPGSKAMKEAMELAKASKNKRVTPYGDKGGDVADLILSGADVSAYIKANIGEWKETEDEQPDIAGTVRVETVAIGKHEIEDATGKIADNDRTIPEPAPAPSEDPLASDWESHLKFTKNGEGLDKSSIFNCSLVLQYHDVFKGIFAFNDFSKEIYLMRRPPWDRRWSGKRPIKDTDATACAGFMETIEYGGLKPKRSDMEAVIARVAEYNGFNPVLDAIEALEWDGRPRLQGGDFGKQTFKPFGVRYLGAADTEINKAFFMRALIGVVARIYEPGCKFDTTLILEGGQGGGKSTAIRRLTDGLLPGVFTDEIADPGSKDAGLQMQGKLIIEFSEMASLRKSDNDTIKGWLSRQTDRFRPPFGKVPKDYPRCCAFIASINPPPNGYLKDATGARRFWPVTIGEIDNDLIREDAAQIWAEAKHLYLEGVQWHLTKEEEAMAKVVQAARLEGDPWNPLIAGFVSSHQMSLKSTITVADIMGSGCLNIPYERRSVTHTGRVEAYLSGPLRWVRVGDGIYQRPLTH